MTNETSETGRAAARERPRGAHRGPCRQAQAEAGTAYRSLRVAAWRAAMPRGAWGGAQVCVLISQNSAREKGRGLVYSRSYQHHASEALSNRSAVRLSERSSRNLPRFVARWDGNLTRQHGHSDWGHHFAASQAFHTSWRAIFSTPSCVNGSSFRIASTWLQSLSANNIAAAGWAPSIGPPERILPDFICCKM